jgi:hypothetical protein
MCNQKNPPKPDIKCQRLVAEPGAATGAGEQVLPASKARRVSGGSSRGGGSLTASGARCRTASSGGAAAGRAGAASATGLGNDEGCALVGHTVAVNR